MQVKTNAYKYDTSTLCFSLISNTEYLKPPNSETNPSYLSSMDLDLETQRRFFKTIVTLKNGEFMENPMDSATLRAYYHRMVIRSEMDHYQNNHQHATRNVPPIPLLLDRTSSRLQPGVNIDPQDYEALKAQSQHQQQGHSHSHSLSLTMHIDPPNLYTLYRCFHCFCISRSTPNMLCEYCCGWFISEMRRLPGGDLEDIFQPADDMWRWGYRAKGPDGWTPPASQDSVAKLSLAPFTSEDMCPICFCDFEIGMLGLKMPCRHIFHQDQDCLREWLKNGYTCPSCRFELPTSDKLFEIHRISEAIFHQCVPSGLPTLH